MTPRTPMCHSELCEESLSPEDTQPRRCGALVSPHPSRAHSLCEVRRHLPHWRRLFKCSFIRSREDGAGRSFSAGASPCPTVLGLKPPPRLQSKTQVSYPMSEPVMRGMHEYLFRLSPFRHADGAAICRRLPREGFGHRKPGKLQLLPRAEVGRRMNPGVRKHSPVSA